MINVLYNIISYMLIISGLAYIALSVLMPRKIMFPNLKKIKIIKEQEYVKGKRRLLLIFGMCWVILCIVLTKNKSIISLIAQLMPMSGLALFVIEKKINKKYWIKIDS